MHPFKKGFVIKCAEYGLDKSAAKELFMKLAGRIPSPAAMLTPAETYSTPGNIIQTIGVGAKKVADNFDLNAIPSLGNTGSALRDSVVEGLGGKAPVPSTYSSGPAVPPMEAKLRAKFLGGPKTLPNKNYFNNMNTGG